MVSSLRLCLGTAQFGMDYGISNVAGRPRESEVRSILEYAAPTIGYVDTAPTYGDAETLIGKCLPRGHQLRVVTKLPPIAAERIEPTHARSAITAIERSLERLRIDCAYGLLLHHSGDMAKPGSE